MSKCNKVKNPCKICLAPVTQKNGLQCQGVCASWIHFNCINYTPGKIKDIKAGLLKINCPCPDCKTTQDKEYYVKDDFTCHMPTCPAKSPPACENIDCVVNINDAACGTKPSEFTIRSMSERTSMESTAGDTGRHSTDVSSDIDKVCTTVAQLTQQINTLMIKLKDTVNKSMAEDDSLQLSTKVVCPNPCHCANNPVQKGKGKKK